MPGHIGIVACSAEGAALCYRTICEEGPNLFGPFSHPDISLHGHSFGDYIRHLDSGDLRAVGGLMLSSATKLAMTGADFAICPDNTIHSALGFVEALSPIPWLRIDDVVADEARRRGFRRVGVCGTAWLMASDVYPRAFDKRRIACVMPEDSERREIHRIIMDELVHGVFRPEAVAFFQRVYARMREEDGCDAVVLGCTEIPLIMNDANAPLPTLDSTRLLARAALREAAEQRV